MKKYNYIKTRAALAAFFFAAVCIIGYGAAFGAEQEADSLEQNSALTDQYSRTSGADFSLTQQKPSGVSASSYSYSKIRVSWDEMEGADGYIVYRSSSRNGTYRRCYMTDNPEKNWYINTGRTSGKTYYYKVRAYSDAEGRRKYSSYSKTVSASARPGKVKVTGVASGGWIYRTFDLSWEPVSGASGYQIYMKEKEEALFSWCGNFRGTGGIVDIPDKTKEYVLKVRAYRTVNGKKVYGKFSQEVSYTFTWQAEELKAAGERCLTENWPQIAIKDTLAGGTPKTPYNSSWSAAWPQRFSRYEPWDQVKQELEDAIRADMEQYGTPLDHVCLYIDPGAESNYVHIYLLN